MFSPILCGCFPGLGFLVFLDCNLVNCAWIIVLNITVLAWQPVQGVARLSSNKCWRQVPTTTQGQAGVENGWKNLEKKD